MPGQTKQVNSEDIREKVVDRVLKMEEEVIRTMSIPENFSLNGWVYILSNQAMPGIYKVGMTTTTPEIRAREVSQGTGVPMPYEVERAFFSDNPRQDEADIHEILGEYRLNPNREFFKCDMEILMQAFDEQGLIERETSVEFLADNCSVITFEKRHRLNLRELFEDMGITTFGDEFAIAEGLIRMGARMVKRQSMDGYSVLFTQGMAQRVMQEITQQYETYLANNQQKDGDAKLYFSPL